MHTAPRLLLIYKLMIDFLIQMARCTWHEGSTHCQLPAYYSQSTHCVCVCVCVYVCVQDNDCTLCVWVQVRPFNHSARPNHSVYLVPMILNLGESIKTNWRRCSRVMCTISASVYAEPAALVLGIGWLFRTCLAWRTSEWWSPGKTCEGKMERWKVNIWRVLRCCLNSLFLGKESFKCPFPSPDDAAYLARLKNEGLGEF